MNEEAVKLEQILKPTPFYEVLSVFGRAVYFPQGIVAQSLQAAKGSYAGNATAGVALEHGHHMILSCIKEALPTLDVDRSVSYAPTAGVLELRAAWRDALVEKNPLLAHKTFTLPIVTAGLTHALSFASDMFVDPGDRMVIFQPSWDNYELIFGVQHRANITGCPMFEDGRLAVNALYEMIMHCPENKIIVLLNFPNNPTGYTPTVEEMGKLVDALVACADEGKRLVVITDDAYFGLFHTPEAAKFSIFQDLCDAHERIIAVKCDAATKEAMVWGFRIGFITYGNKEMSSQVMNAMIQKTMGIIRATVSSSSHVGQNLLLEALRDGRFKTETAAVAAEMAERRDRVRIALKGHRSDEDLLRPLPFNSGYFFSLVCKGNPEELRQYLLENHGIGTISLEGRYLRIAYSGVDREVIGSVIDTVYRGARLLWK